MSTSIRVLIADDSATIRDAVAALLKEEPGIEVVGMARDGVEAFEMARALRPDVITMDVAMPRMDGLEATSAILAETPTRIVIVSSVSQEAEVDLSFRAVSAGALEVIAKHRGGPQALPSWGKNLAQAIRLMAEVPVVTRRRTTSLARPLMNHRGGTVDAFGIVASTGGPPLLAKVLRELPRELPIPVLVAQHISEGFTTGLVRWLSAESALRVKVARAGEACAPGHVYFAPDRHHLEVDDQGLIRLALHTSPLGHVPSGDRLLQSLAIAYGRRCGAMVLTGMGEDGAAGLLDVKRAGGQTFVQDEASCVVFGMPRAALLLGATQTQVSVDSISGMIRQLAT